MASARRDEDAGSALLVKVAKGDRHALGELFAIEASRLIGIARRIVRRQDLAEDVVQEAFVSVWRNAGRFDPARGTAKAWLTTIVRNRALNVVRDGARLEFLDEAEIASFHDRATDAENAFDRLSEGDALRHCLDQLEPNRRRCILLAYVVGYSHGEIAVDLKAPIGTVKAWVRRGTIALQECLS